MDLKLPSVSATVMQNALYFVHLANATYLDSPKEYEYFGDFGFEKFETFTSDDGVNFGLAARIDGALLVAMRGSDDVVDWWNNFQFGQVADYDGKVHSGFYDAANSIWKDIARVLWKTWNQGDVVWIAGHSLGGAMATLMAKWLDYEKYEIAGVHTFGQPRVGDNTFADKYPADDVHYRFVNNKDFVAQVPYRWMGPGIFYKHVGKVYHFDENGDLSRSDKKWDDLVESFTDNMLIRGPRLGRKPDFGFADHGIQHYIARIEAALAG